MSLFVCGCVCKRTVALDLPLGNCQTKFVNNQYASCVDVLYF